MLLLFGAGLGLAHGAGVLNVRRKVKTALKRLSKKLSTPVYIERELETMGDDAERMGLATNEDYESDGDESGHCFLADEHVPMVRSSGYFSDDI